MPREERSFQVFPHWFEGSGRRDVIGVSDETQVSTAGNASTELRGDEMAAKISERETREAGIIEGKLEAISVHDRRVCAIYDPITGERVQGTFGADLIAEADRASRLRDWRDHLQGRPGTRYQDRRDTRPGPGSDQVGQGIARYRAQLVPRHAVRGLRERTLGR